MLSPDTEYRTSALHGLLDAVKFTRRYWDADGFSVCLALQPHHPKQEFYADLSSEYLSKVNKTLAGVYVVLLNLNAPAQLLRQ